MEKALLFLLLIFPSRLSKVVVAPVKKPHFPTSSLLQKGEGGMAGNFKRVLLCAYCIRTLSGQGKESTTIEGNEEQGEERRRRRRRRRRKPSRS